MQACAYEHNRTAGVSDTMLAALPSRAEYLEYSATEILGSAHIGGNYSKRGSVLIPATQGKPVF